MKLWPSNKLGRVVAVFVYCFLLFAVIAAFGGLKSSFNKGAGISTASPVGEATHHAAPKTSAPATPSPAANVDHVHFVVQGSSTAVATWERDGDLPNNIVVPGDARIVLNNNTMVYTLAAALQGGGQVTVKIFIDGKLMSQATAKGGVNTAIATIIRNSNGVWVGAVGNNG